MKELAKPTGDPTEVFTLVEYNEPLAEYVHKLAEKIKPYGEDESYKGMLDSQVYVNFIHRYFDNKVNTSFIDEYEDDEVLKDMITTLGYDFDKFWYLLLFINDLSYCACKRETEFFKSAFEYLEEIHRYVAEEGAELTIRVKGKKKVEIIDHKTLDLIKQTVKDVMDNVGKGNLNSIYPKHYSFNVVKENSKSYHIWYFATLFLMFYELVPPKNIRKKKGYINSYNKKLLISRLVYLVGLGSNKTFLTDEYIINGFLKQYKDSSIYDKMVIEYFF